MPSDTLSSEKRPNEYDNLALVGSSPTETNAKERNMTAIIADA